MSSYVPAHEISSALPENHSKSFVDVESSGDESSGDNYVEDNTTLCNDPTPDTEDDGSVFDDAPALDSEEPQDADEVAPPPGWDPRASRLLKAPSERYLADECDTVEEVLEALADGFEKHQKNLPNYKFQPSVDFQEAVVETADELYRAIAQKSFNAGFRLAKAEGSKHRAQRKWIEEQAMIEAAAAKAARRLQEEEEREHGDEADYTHQGRDQDSDDNHQESSADTDSDSSSSDDGDYQPKKEKKKAPVAPQQKKRRRVDPDGDFEEQVRWQLYKKRKLASSRAATATHAPLRDFDLGDEDDSLPAHDFGAIDGMYRAPDYGPHLSVSQPVMNSAAYNPGLGNGEGPSNSSATQPAGRKRAYKSGPNNRAKKTTRAFVASDDYEQVPEQSLTAAQEWFLEKADIKPPLVKEKSTRPGTKNRKPKMKIRGDWGTPRRKITKADYQIIRKHGKYTTEVYEDKDVADLPMSHREALHYEKLPGAKGWKYKLERGDVSDEDPIIDGRMIRFELLHFRKIRKGKQARRQRLAQGEDQDSESSLSDDDSQYNSDRADCGWDLDERMEYYLAKERAKEAGVEEDVEEPPRRKGKGKARAVQKVYEEEYGEEREGDDEEDGYEGETAVENAAQPTQTFQRDATESEEE